MIIYENVAEVIEGLNNEIKSGINANIGRIKQSKKLGRGRIAYDATPGYFSLLHAKTAEKISDELARNSFNPSDFIVYPNFQTDRDLVLASCCFNPESEPDYEKSFETINKVAEKVKKGKIELGENVFAGWLFPRIYADKTKPLDRLYAEHAKLYFSDIKYHPAKIKMRDSYELPGSNRKEVYFGCGDGIPVEVQEFSVNSTPPLSVRDILKECKINKSNDFCDFGTYIGIPPIVAATEFDVKEAVGIECFEEPVSVANKVIIPLLKEAGVKNTERVRIINDDFFREPHEQTVKFVSLTNYSDDNLAEIAGKMEKESAKGTKIITVSHKLGLSNSFELMKKNFYPMEWGLAPVYFYEKIR